VPVHRPTPSVRLAVYPRICNACAALYASTPTAAKHRCNDKCSKVIMERSYQGKRRMKLTQHWMSMLIFGKGQRQRPYIIQFHAAEAVTRQNKNEKWNMPGIFDWNTIFLPHDQDEFNKNVYTSWMQIKWVPREFVLSFSVHFLSTILALKSGLVHSDEYGSTKDIIQNSHP
jgi:hypothetical protein